MRPAVLLERYRSAKPSPRCAPHTTTAVATMGRTMVPAAVMTRTTIAAPLFATPCNTDVRRCGIANLLMYRPLRWVALPAALPLGLVVAVLVAAADEGGGGGVLR